MNMRLLSRVTTPVKLWIYSHECGHQFRGPDEETADCFAVQRGRRQGWLSPGGVEEICQFISPAKGDAMHFFRLAPVRIHAAVPFPSSASAEPGVDLALPPAPIDPATATICAPLGLLPGVGAWRRAGLESGRI